MGYKTYSRFLSHCQYTESLSCHIRAPDNEILRCKYYIWGVKNYWFYTTRILSSRETILIIWNSKFHCSVNNKTLLIPVLKQINLVRALSFYSIKIRFNIIFPSTPRSSKFSLSFMLPHHTHLRVCYLPSMCDKLPTWLTVKQRRLF